MDEFDGRNGGFGGEPHPQREPGRSADWLPALPGRGMLRHPDQDPRDLFACPFCDSPIQLAIRPGERQMIAECPSCGSWFTRDEWRYYKLLAA